MLENINYALFAGDQRHARLTLVAITLATLIAKDLILIVPLLTAALWLWRPNQRQLVFKVMLALAISLTLSWIFGLLFPHERPFAADVGYQFLHHSPNNSFPSNHGTISFTFALAFYSGIGWAPGSRCWPRRRLSPGLGSISACTGRWICSAAC
ncbi:Putative undecaprenyl-diphosphatase ybjG [Raoultella terrigena]|uniref:Undecaprenyl-diphosphatase ybjG n=1 Tax=Raoultella terrigena TaxID=577 RepID=A0A4U9DFT1_RAOTE|nr:Putative undecaprenyl-diphosphatase ybjG [Raoultella terrigena]